MDILKQRISLLNLLCYFSTNHKSPKAMGDTELRVRLRARLRVRLRALLALEFGLQVATHQPEGSGGHEPPPLTLISVSHVLAI